MDKKNNPMQTIIRYILLLLILLTGPSLYAQKSKKEKAPRQSTLSTAELDNYKQKIKLMVGFLEYIFNTVGCDTAFANDKETIINTSYLKVFQSDKVQVEDDLVEDRKVITNKNIQAYLRDIDYFYKNVKFELKIDNITENFTDKNRLYFVVTLNRHLKGVNIENQTINTNSPRYVEVNLDPKQLDLKIVSIYTSKISEEEDLNKWWTALPAVWKEHFYQNTGMSDSTLDYGHLKRLINTEEIDLKGNKKISDLEPLNKFIKLKKLNCNNTAIASLSGIRNLTHIEALSFNATPVADLEPLKYFIELKELYADSTGINSLEFLRPLASLEIFHSSKTAITTLEPISGLVNLKEVKFPHTEIADLNWAKNLVKMEVLDFSDSKVASLEPLTGLVQLKQLYLYNTGVSDLKPLEKLNALTIINCNNTQVNSLDALKNLHKIEKIYCDKSKVSSDEALTYSHDHSTVLVIAGSEESMTWWNSLPSEWKMFFNSLTNFPDPPTREHLAMLTSLQKLDISGNDKIQNLTPLKAFHNLKDLRLNNSAIKTLAPISNLSNLQHLEFGGTEINSLDPLWGLTSILQINADNSKIDSLQVYKYILNHPKCVVLYKTKKLNTWWKSLPLVWQSIFMEAGVFKDPPTAYDLHKLVYTDTVKIDGKSITNLIPLLEFPFLRSLHFSNTQVSDLSPLKNMKNLKQLECTKNPIKDLNSLQSLTTLEFIDIENTAVEALDPLEKLTALNTLKCPGTQVSSLKPLEKLSNLSLLDCSNTRVGNLNALEELKKIKTLTCFNTRVSKRQVEKFTKIHPGCQVNFY
jgi:Leucine-rich repeat (LRR) protein